MVARKTRRRRDYGPVLLTSRGAWYWVGRIAGAPELVKVAQFMCAECNVASGPLLPV